MDGFQASSGSLQFKDTYTPTFTTVFRSSPVPSTVGASRPIIRSTWPRGNTANDNMVCMHICGSFLLALSSCLSDGSLDVIECLVMVVADVDDLPNCGFYRYWQYT